MTERELIELTVEYGFTGAEMNNSYFKKRGYLNTSNGAYESFKKKIDAICDSWERLKKKRGEPVQYHLINLYDKAKAIPDNRVNNGYVEREEEKIMKEFIYQQLYAAQNIETFREAHSISKWIRLLNFKQTNDISDESFSNVKKHFSKLGYWEKSELNKVIASFKNKISSRNREVLKSVLRMLEKEDRIKVTSFNIFVDTKNDMAIVNDEKYKTAKDIEKQILDKYGLTYNHYYNFNFPVVKLAKSEVEFTLAKELDITRFYTSKLIRVTGSAPDNRVTYDEFYKAFSTRLVALVEKLQDKEAYKNDNSNVDKRFYAYNILYLSSKFIYPVDKCLLAKYRPLEEEIDEIHHNIFEKIDEKQSEKFKLGFGNAPRKK